MDTTQIQELCEAITVAALNGGPLAGYVFRHGDTPAKKKPDQITAEAGAPVPQLDGPRGFRVDVTVELQTETATRNASLHAEALRRLTSASTWHAAALSVGMQEADDLFILDEEIGGERENTKSLRRRTITVPMIIRVHGNGNN